MRTDEKGRPRTQRGAQGCPPSPIKTPKHPGKKTRSGNRLSLTGQRQLWLGRWAEAPPPPTESVPCPWDVPIQLSTFHEKPGLRASPRKRPGYNYSFILPAETKSKSPLLPSSTRPLGDSEEKCGCERGRVKFAWGRTRGREERGPFVGR